MSPSPNKMPVAFSDVLWGIPQIAAELGRTKRQVLYLVEKRKIRVDWIGPKMPVTTRTRLREDFAAVLSEAGEKSTSA